jgi:hypothetical protein
VLPARRGRPLFFRNTFPDSHNQKAAYDAGMDILLALVPLTLIFVAIVWLKKAPKDDLTTEEQRDRMAW